MAEASVPPMDVLAISGSLRNGSTNTAVVRALTGLAPEIARVRIYAEWAGLPAFNPDLDGDAPPDAVAAFRAALRASRAVVLSMPEYAYGIPGALKNALDWSVSSGEFWGRPVLAINASPQAGGAAHAHAALRLVLTAMDARPVEFVHVPVTRAQVDAAGCITDPAARAALTGAVEAFLRRVAAL